MKFCLNIIVLFTVWQAAAQEKTPRSEFIFIKGDIKNEKRIQLPDLEKIPPEDLGNVVITNHAGEVKGTARNLKGIKLKELLSSVQLSTDNPKLNSTYYFVMTAADGYKVVFSWNELFNNAGGDKVYIVTSKDGLTLQEMPERILLICPTDLQTGRRYIKGLSEISVQRVQ